MVRFSQEICGVFRVEPSGDDCGHGCAVGVLKVGFQHVFRPVHRLSGDLVRVRCRDQFRCGLFLYLEGSGVLPEQKVVLQASWRLQPFLHRGISGQDGFPASDPKNIQMECRVVQPVGIVRIRRAQLLYERAGCLPPQEIPSFRESPSETPGRKVTKPPIRQPFPMVIGFAHSSRVTLSFGSVLWLGGLSASDEKGGQSETTWRIIFAYGQECRNHLPSARTRRLFACNNPSGKNGDPECPNRT